MEAKIGDYVTFNQAGFPEGDGSGLRQGLFIGNSQVLFEPDELTPKGTIVKCTRIYAIVPDKNLLPGTLEWVQKWRQWHRGIDYFPDEEAV